MALKDVKEYRERLQDDLLEMRDNLNEMESIAMTSIISPEQIDNTRRLVDEMKQNLARVDWILFLLEQPSDFDKFLIKLHLKKDPSKQYDLDPKHSPEAIHKEHKELIEKVKKIFTGK